MKLRYSALLILSCAGLVQAPFSADLFPVPQRGPDVTTLTASLRSALARFDIAGARQSLSNLQYKLGFPWNELMRRFADGYFTPGMVFDTTNETWTNLFKQITGVYPYEIDKTKAKGIWLAKIERELNVAIELIRKLLNFFEQNKGIRFAQKESDPLGQLQEFLDKLEQNDQLFADSKDQIEALQKRLVELEAQDRDRLADKDKKKPDDLSTKLDMEKNRLETTIEQQKLELATLKTKVKQLADQNKKLGERIEQQKQQGLSGSSKQQNELKKLQQELGSIRLQERKQRKLLEEKNTEINRLKSEKKNVDAQLKQLGEKVQQVSSMEEAIKKITSEKSQLQEEKLAIEKRLEDQNKAQEALRKTNETLTNELVAARVQIAALGASATEVESLRRKIGELEKKVQANQEAKQTLDATVEQLQKTIREKDEQLQKKDNELSQVQANLEKEREVRGQLEAKNQELAGLQTSQKVTIDGLKKQVERISSLEQEVASLKLANEGLRSDLELEQQNALDAQVDGSRVTSLEERNKKLTAQLQSQENRLKGLAESITAPIKTIVSIEEISDKGETGKNKKISFSDGSSEMVSESDAKNLLIAQLRAKNFTSQQIQQLGLSGNLDKEIEGLIKPLFPLGLDQGDIGVSKQKNPLSLDAQPPQAPMIFDQSKLQALSFKSLRSYLPLLKRVPGIGP